jgi:phosphate:Na+ symporter
VGILLSLGGAGVTLSSVVYIIYGQNIGTCITAIMAAIGTTKAAKRASLIHLLFNTIGAISFLLITLYSPFLNLIQNLVPGSIKAQIPVVHVVFNLITTAVLLPFSKLLINLACKLIPGEEDAQEDLRLVYLDNRILNSPSIAVSQLIKEVIRMANLSKKIFKAAMKGFLERNPKKVKKVYQNEDTINFLNRNITEYLVKINGLDISDSDKRLVGALFHIINDIERIGDYCENIAEFSEIIMNGSTRFTEEAIEEIEAMKILVESILNEAIFMFSTDNQQQDLIDIINSTENEIDDKTEEFKITHIERLNSGRCDPVAATIFMDLLNSLERIADHATNIAFGRLTGAGLKKRKKLDLI